MGSLASLGLTRFQPLRDVFVVNKIMQKRLSLTFSVTYICISKKKKVVNKNSMICSGKVREDLTVIQSSRCNYTRNPLRDIKHYYRKSGYNDVVSITATIIESSWFNPRPRHVVAFVDKILCFVDLKQTQISIEDVGFAESNPQQ